MIRFNLKSIYSYFGYDRYASWVFKVTKDAEIDMDSDISTSLIQKSEKGVKNRRKGNPFGLCSINKWTLVCSIT